MPSEGGGCACMLGYKGRMNTKTKTDKDRARGNGQHGMLYNESHISRGSYKMTLSVGNKNMCKRRNTERKYSKNFLKLHIFLKSTHFSV